MKKLIFAFLSILAGTGCSNVEQVGPFEDEKTICRENVDTIIAHMNGWKELSSYYNRDDFHSTTDKDGKKTVYTKYVLVVTVSDDHDTLMIRADATKSMYNMKSYKDEEAWNGYVFSRNLTFSKNVAAIKRHNLAIKEACGNDTCFVLEAGSNKVLSAEFVKWKPKESEPPLEDYGLTEDDIKK